MKLYVWDDHFYDYQVGLAVVLAPDLDTARLFLEVAIGFDHPDILAEPAVYDLDSPRAFYVHGGS